MLKERINILLKMTVLLEHINFNSSKCSMNIDIRKFNIVIMV